MTPPKPRPPGEHRTEEQRLADLERTVDRYIDDRRLAQGDSAARSARQRAANLARLVREEGPDGIGAYLDSLDLEQLYAVATTLAAMVPVDVPVSRLLGWLDVLEEGAA